MSLLVAFPFCAKDVARLHDLLQWCFELSGKVNYDALLVADPATPWDDGVRALHLAEKAFQRVDICSLPAHVEGWIAGSNALFRLAAEKACERKTPFLFVEADAVPLKPDWLDQLADAYQRSGKPFMGVLISHQRPNLPSPYLEGVAIYPPDALEIMRVWPDDLSWTLGTAGTVVSRATSSPLFYHLWGETNNPPTFRENNIPGTNVFCPRQIPPEAVIYHRAKDGSLIRLLRKARGIPTAKNDLLIVLPFCHKDAAQFQKTLRWCAELDGQQPYTALLSYDSLTPITSVNAMEHLAGQAFAQVRKTFYATPRPPVWYPTIAFNHAARAAVSWHMPWLWFEYDMIPLKPGWIQVLLDAYNDAGKPFMAPIVNGMGHANGTGIYPSDTPARIPKAMADTRHAWDMTMKDEMIQDCYDCGHLLQHVWVIDSKGKFQPHGNGMSPIFRTSAQMNQILPTATAFHRCKDGTLIDRLKERKR